MSAINKSTTTFTLIQNHHSAGDPRSSQKKIRNYPHSKKLER